MQDPRNNLIDKQGRRRTKSLFWEYRLESDGQYEPVFTLADYDRPCGCKSMYHIYMAADTEYEAAQTLLGSWAHWEKLCECTWFKPFIDQWRKEVRIREKAIAKTVLLEQASEGNVTAAKALIEEDKKRGRPSKQEIAQNAKEAEEVEEFLRKSQQRLQSVK